MKKLSFVLFVILVFSMLAENTPLNGKKVVIVISEKNYRDEELDIPKKVLESNGAKVTIASTTLDEATGMKGGKAKPDILIENINPGSFDGIIFVGGVGAQSLWDNKNAQSLAKEFNQAEKPLGAICLAPVILARAGLLENTAATAYKSASDELKKCDAMYVDKTVVVYKNIITANGPGASEEFAKHYSGMLIPEPNLAPHDR
ncbi:MAG: DJ-1/PfpI family protein [Candidatus Zixiibacteriota bacterium]